MRYDTRYRSRSSLFNWSFPSGVKWLIIVNTAIWIFYFFAYRWIGDGLFIPLKLVPAMVVRGAVWQPVTYLFLHDPQGIMVHADPLSQHLVLTAERKFWRCVQSGETPCLFGIDLPRPRIERVGAIDTPRSHGANATPYPTAEASEPTSSSLLITTS